MIVTGDQIRMARALLRMSVRELSEAAAVDKSTISRIENGADAYTSTFRQLRSVLEARGAWFGEAEDGTHGPTVALKCGVQPFAAFGERLSRHQRGRAGHQRGACRVGGMSAVLMPPPKMCTIHTE